MATVPSNTLCSVCQAALYCGASAKRCWCQSMPSLAKSAYQDRSCLCAPCLQAALLEGVVLFGIPNCDTVKKARAWLAEHNIEYVFWDFKKHGVPADLLASWVAALGWQALVNTRGTTWRGLDEASKASVVDAASAIALLCAQPSLIKRPVVNWGMSKGKGEAVTVGFSAEAWSGLTKSLHTS